LLGILLGALPAIFNAGELKALNRPEAGKEICSCGQTLASCEFWSDLKPGFAHTSARPRWRDWVSTCIGMVSRAVKPGGPNGRDAALIQAIAAKAGNPENPPVIVDVSKSLWRLNRLLREPGLSIDVVWIRKSLPASIGSLIKRGRSFWPALLRASLSDAINSRFLKASGMGFVTIWYEELAIDEGKVIRDLLSQLAIADQDGKFRSKKNAQAHLVTGNEGTRRSLREGSEIHVSLDHSWRKRLTNNQSRIALWLGRKRRQPVDVY
jgi:hypothetical protein